MGDGFDGRVHLVTSAYIPIHTAKLFNCSLVAQMETRCPNLLSPAPRYNKPLAKVARRGGPVIQVDMVSQDPRPVPARNVIAAAAQHHGANASLEDLYDFTGVRRRRVAIGYGSDSRS